MKTSATEAAAKGRLYVVATPIGNLEDITLRGLRVLREVDLVAAEDTRQTRKLLSYYQISKPLVSYHTHNEAERGPELIHRLQEGMTVGLVSDAGTPGFSDPGAALVARAWGADIPVTAIPGPAAGIAALSMSGFTGDVAFIGFLPRQVKKRLEFFQQLAQEPRILIMYESPRRLGGTLQELCRTMGERQILVVRELTKLYEESWRGPLAAVTAELSSREIRGECALVLSRPEHLQKPTVDVKGYLLEAARTTRKRGRALALEAAEVLGVSRREAYQTYLALKAARQIPEE
ncbi:16S rRNA (cytidine(1402)-2'-O)-methyltransferase [Desulfobacca acetoxidans]|uniref:Ribosomal RNA small subunit methyltransferase I n=1 Tax=Desulfobacca acetoxidans (strain ATCC 700848 / DSM 11109 / ASRB2) TaxID=880072 RepID=F2NF74_DESAR|nr:16S rRNA (cytidine(1402)-2'-O)-methyltransferase [Desulfobacca acetoxidans]AEB08629.1 Ribosomal RNA small subunit methyltransferase I [Desulfobacca acetoxidans DSM 11109]